MPIAGARITEIRSRYESLKSVMDERVTRLWAAGEAKALGRGGIAAVTKATGILGKRIRYGMRDLTTMRRSPPTESPREQRVRRPGAGRKPLTETDPTLVPDLESLVDPMTRGDPESPLRWTCKSIRKLAEELRAMGHQVSAQKVSELLHELRYSLQGRRKTREGASHPDRNAQFEHINAQARSFQRVGAAGDLRGHQEEGAGRRFQEPRQGVAVPRESPSRCACTTSSTSDSARRSPTASTTCGRNEAWVSVGVDHDTAEFAVDVHPPLVAAHGTAAPTPTPRELLVTADGGGSNGYRSRLWKLELQRFADETGLNDHRLPLPAGHEQVEQDRASAVLPHHAELARPPPGERGDDRQLDRRHHDDDRTPHQGGARQEQLREGDQGLGRGTRQSPTQAPSLPRRLELHDSPDCPRDRHAITIASVIPGRRLTRDGDADEVTIP